MLDFSHGLAVQVAGKYVQNVLGLDDQAPPGPDQTRASKGKVLGEGELLGRASHIGNTSNYEAPLHSKQVSLRLSLIASLCGYREPS